MPVDVAPKALPLGELDLMNAHGGHSNSAPLYHQNKKVASSDPVFQIDHFFN